MTVAPHLTYVCVGRAFLSFKTKNELASVQMLTMFDSKQIVVKVKEMECNLPPTHPPTHTYLHTHTHTKKCITDYFL